MTNGKEFLELARKRFKLAADAKAMQDGRMLEALRFKAGDQWPVDVMMDRRLNSRPCLVINRLPQFQKQVTNEFRQQRPQIHTHPTQDGDLEIEKAEIYEGLLRTIQINSDADIAQDTAFEAMTTGGVGYMRILTDYEGDDSFDQIIKVGWVPNIFTIYMDPGAMEPNKEDARWCFISQDIPRDEFERDYPDADAVGASYTSMGDEGPMWLSDKSVRVAEYYYIEETDKKIYLLPTGEVTDFLPEGMLAIRQRVVKTPRVKWAKISGCDVLEERDVPGQFIPVIGMYGNRVDLNGEIRYSGMIQDAMDPQRRYNFMVSAETEMIALAPRSPFIMAEGQDEGFEEQWATANQRSYSRLIYKPKAIGGTVLGAPQRNQYEPPINAIGAGIAQASEDLKHTTGIYSASLGDRGPENSGRAIIARQKESDVANLNYADNAKRSMRHAGRVMLSMIPEVYDTPRILRIVKGDLSNDQVQVNAPTEVKGQERNYDLTIGKYDISVDIGPSYATKREQSAETMIETAKVLPQVAQVAPDLIVQNLDFPGAQEVAKRLKKSLPPGLVDDDNQAPIPPQVQQKMQQDAQRMQALDQIATALTEQVNALTEKLESKDDELRSKEKIASEANQTKLLQTLAALDAKLSESLITRDYAATQHTLEMSHAKEMAENASGNQQALAAQQQQAAEPTGEPAE